MKTHYALSLLLLLLSLGAFAQAPQNAPHRPATLVQHAERTGSQFQSTSLFEISSQESTIPSHPQLKKALRKGTLLNIKTNALRTFNQNPSRNLRLEVPTHEGSYYLKMVEVKIIDPNMPVRTSSQGNVNVDFGRHYRGVIEGHTNSIVAVSIYKDEIMGVFSSNELNGNCVLGKLQKENATEHIIYHDNDLLEPMAFGCLTPDKEEGYTPSQLLPPPPKEDEGDCVLIYVEADYTVYTANSSSIAQTTGYLVGIFNQAITLFANENINMGISDIFIWTSPSPYGGGADSIRNDWQDSTDAINGDIGHFIYWQSSGGSGIAAGFDALCNADVDAKLCVTKTSLNYETAPIYSRSVKVITHEMGHLLGSVHTHACRWNGNNTTIDDYGNVSPSAPGDTVEGAEGKNCFTPPGKTDVNTYTPTIMSYYDSRGWGDLPLANGFGSQPGDVVRNMVENASCLDACCDFPDADCQNITRSLGAVTGTVSITAGSVDDGSTWDCGFRSWRVSKSSFDCDDVGNNTVTLTVTDTYYRTSQCEATVTIEDNTNPTAICKNITVFLDANGDVSITGADIDNNSFDNCDIQSRVADPDEFDCSTIGAQSSTLTVTDENGRSASCVAGVYVDDTAAKPPKLSKQNCNNCNQLRIFYCQFDPAPASLNEFINGSVQMNDTYVPGNPLFWYTDAGGSPGPPFGGTGAQPPTPNMNIAAATYYYWVAQINQISGCVGDAIRVRVRVRKTPTPVFDYTPSPHCFGAQVDLPEWVDDPNNVADIFDFYDGDPDGGGSLIGNVSATNGNPNGGEYVVVLPQVGVNEYWVVATNVGNANSITCTAKTSMTIPVADTASLDYIADQTVNHGDNVNITFSSPNAMFIFWIDHSSFNNPDIGLMGEFGAGNMSFQAYNPDPFPRSAMIRVLTYIGNCAGQYRDFYITVNPSPIRLASRNLLSLTAFQLNAHEVQLDWNITYNQELVHFEVEKLKAEIAAQDDITLLVNAENWENLGTVAYDESKSSYTFTDNKAASQTTKYRLKLVHADGTIVWSDIVEVNYNLYEGDRFVLYPNPSDGLFHLKSALPMSGNWNYQLVDVLGRNIAQGALANEGQSFDLNGEVPGVYFLILRSPEGKRYMKRMVKK